MPVTTPPGRKTEFPDRYARDVLCSLPRAENRATLGLHGALPFHGEDIWNAYELTWLDSKGKPVVAAASLRVDAGSSNLVESKSLKLYLNSLAMERFASTDDVAALISSDLSAVTASNVRVKLSTPSGIITAGLEELPGDCIDSLDVECDVWQVAPALLECESAEIVREELHSHLMRSSCPVTSQPDFGSILVRYRGARIARAGLLRYLVSYRHHSDFHESCIERMFVDLKARCAPFELTVYGRFNRRGGLDINPFRSDFENRPDNPRLWRQ
jgi:7-cyano-7-deazaguanine reductase